MTVLTMKYICILYRGIVLYQTIKVYLTDLRNLLKLINNQLLLIQVYK